MRSTSFAHTLIRKSERALKSAALALRDGDCDTAVNRSYYAMFDIVRVALLRSGIAEEEMPRTHGGVSEAFWRSAVQSGQFDPDLGAELSRTESLRIKADYTGVEIDPQTATGAVEKAELFVQAVKRVFSLDASFPDADDKVSEPDVARERSEGRSIDVQSPWLEEERRQARENWLRLRQQIN
ncbi:MAG: HEPN domain-containing protein [Steroidobacteraceae bacterium]